jgi:hypothetical protein
MVLRRPKEARMIWWHTKRKEARLKNVKKLDTNTVL